MGIDACQREEGEILEHRNVPTAIDELSTSPDGGLDSRAGDTAARYLDVLVYSLKTDSVRNPSIVLTALLRTRSKKLLTAIVKPDGLHILSAMLSMHQHSYQMTPILRTTLRLLQHLAKHGVLRGRDLTCSAPHFCTPEFSQILFDLTKHSDPQVRTLAKTFQKVRFEIPRGNPAHHACQHAQKRLI